MSAARVGAAFALAAAAALAPPPAAASGNDALRPTDRGAAAGGATWVGERPTSPPRRVVVLAPSLTDDLVAMGLAGRLVGVTRLDDAPEVASLPRVGGFLDPSPEAVLALSPDLVLWVTDSGALAAVRRIAELSRASRRPFSILAIPIVNVADVLATPRILGEALGAPDAGERLARDLTARVEAVWRRAAGASRPRVLFVVGHEPLVVAGPGSFPDELLRICGARNVVGGDRPWPVYPLEKAVADDPDVVVDAAPREPAEGLRRFAAIRAIRKGAVVRLRNDDLIRPGPRMIRALGWLFAELHRESRR